MLQLCGFFFLIGEQLLYNTVLFLPYNNSNQQELCIYIPSLKNTPVLPSHLSRSAQSARLGSLCCRAASNQLAISHMIVCTCQCYLLNSCYPLLPLLCASDIDIWEESGVRDKLVDLILTLQRSSILGKIE